MIRVPSGTRVRSPGGANATADTEGCPAHDRPRDAHPDRAGATWPDDRLADSFPCRQPPDGLTFVLTDHGPAPVPTLAIPPGRGERPLPGTPLAETADPARSDAPAATVIDPGAGDGHSPPPTGADPPPVGRELVEATTLPANQGSPLDPGATTATQTLQPPEGSPIPGHPPVENRTLTLPPTGTDAANAGAGFVAGYEILDELGRGGMGVVYKARQRRLNRLVALKMIRAGGHARPEHLARFRIEAEAVARLRHPNIVQIYDIGEVDGLPFFALELLEGGSLADRLAGTPAAGRAGGRAGGHAGPGRARRAPRRGSSTATSSRPTSCSTADGIPKITDFGLAKRLEADERPDRDRPGHGHAQLHGPRAGPRRTTTDVGPAGRRLRPGRDPLRDAHRPAAVQGRRPPMETVRQVIDDEPVPPSRLQSRRSPRDLETICLKCLAKEPHRRYASAAGPGRRPGPLPGRRADPGPPDARLGARAEVGPAAADGRHADRRRPGRCYRLGARPGRGTTSDRRRAGAGRAGPHGPAP